MQHLDEGTIHSWLDGALDAREAAEVEAHAASCAQCAAAAAEARGFIAGASRILTALDRVPSGVVPVTTAERRKNWPIWRAAAAIAVVALGSLVVVKRGTEDTKTTAVDSAAARLRIMTPPASAPEIASAETPQAERRSSAIGSVRGRAPSTESVAKGLKTAEPTEFSRVGSVAAAMDAASNTLVPRAVGNRQGFDGSSTYYEIAPGDTVVLTEVSDVRLESMVVTGLGAQASKPTAALGAARTMAKAATPDTQRRTVPQSQVQLNAQSSAQPAAPTTVPATAAAPAPAPPAMQNIASAYNTITWIDSATGKTMRLSGRHPTAVLQEIRQTIEETRAAKAREKKQP